MYIEMICTGAAKGRRVILYYEGRKILVKIEDQEISFLTFKEAAVYNPDVYEEYTYLFSIDGQGYYLAEGLIRRFPRIRTEGQSVFPRGKTEIQTVCGSDGMAALPLVSVAEVLRSLRTADGA